MDLNMTPDELRQEADRLARRGDGADAHIVRAAADAWEADLANWKADYDQVWDLYDATEARIEELSKRLEAAEKKAKRLKKWLQHLDRCAALDGWKCNCGLDAALAGEVKPTNDPCWREF